jgi:hypothetical protein
MAKFTPTCIGIRTPFLTQLPSYSQQLIYHGNTYDQCTHHFQSLEFLYHPA